MHQTALQADSLPCEPPGGPWWESISLPLVPLVFGPKKSEVGPYATSGKFTAQGQRHTQRLRWKHKVTDNGLEPKQLEDAGF